MCEGLCVSVCLSVCVIVYKCVFAMRVQYVRVWRLKPRGHSELQNNWLKVGEENSASQPKYNTNLDKNTQNLLRPQEITKAI